MSSQRLFERGNVAGEELLESAAPSRTVGSTVVDAENERNGATRDAGHDVGRTHGETSNNLRDGSWNVHAERLEHAE